MSRRFRLAMAGEYENKCGECTECCRAVGVAELGKPYNCRCEHQTDTGCGAYDSRPPSCREWFCAWLAGFITGDDRRPDKLGVIFAPGQDRNGNTSINVTETRPGAFNELSGEQVDYLLRRINTHLPRPLAATFIPHDTTVGVQYPVDEEKYPDRSAEYLMKNTVVVNPITGDEMIKNLTA